MYCGTKMGQCQCGCSWGQHWPLELSHIYMYKYVQWSHCQPFPRDIGPGILEGSIFKFPGQLKWSIGLWHLPMYIEALLQCPSCHYTGLDCSNCATSPMHCVPRCLIDKLAHSPQTVEPIQFDRSVVHVSLLKVCASFSIAQYTQKYLQTVRNITIYSYE